MYQILNPNNKGRGRRVPIQNLSTSRAVILREVQRVTSYYHKQPNLVAVDHILVRVINLLTISMKRNDYGVVDACMDRTPQVAMTLGLVHPLNSDVTGHTGHFYNNHVNEIIIAHDSDEPDYDLLKRSWYSMSAIKIITHPFADMNMHLCDGKYPSNGEGGYAVIIIDTPMLMLQYKYWRQRAMNNGGTVDTLSARHFISQMVIPNMLLEHLDICFINRAMRSYRKQASPFRRKVHPNQIVDFSPKADEVIDQQVAALQDGQVDINDLYTMFPAMLKESWLSSIKLPDVVPNLNTTWALDMATLPYINFLLEVMAVSNPTMIRQVAGELRRDLRRLSTTKEIDNMSTNMLSLLKLRLNER